MRLREGGGGRVSVSYAWVVYYTLDVQEQGGE